MTGQWISTWFSTLDACAAVSKRMSLSAFGEVTSTPTCTQKCNIARREKQDGSNLIQGLSFKYSIYNDV
jgi:hypothetical protein